MDEKGFLNGVDKTYKRFISQLQSSPQPRRNGSACPACPVCSRDFKDQQEVDDTVRELTTYSQKLPRKMHAIDDKLADTELRLQRLISLKPTKETYERLRTTEIPELKQQIEALDRQVTPKLKRELQETEALVKKAERARSAAETMQPEVVLIDKYCSEIAQLDRRVDEQQRLVQSSRQGESTDDENVCGSSLRFSPLGLKFIAAIVNSHKLYDFPHKINGHIFK